MHASTRPARPTHPPIELDRGLLKELARPAPARLLLQTAFEWSCIVALVVAAASVSHPAFSAACMLLIATRQHALLTLMHEYAHHQFSRRRAWLNDLIGDVFTALPFFITVHGFRRNHLAHHRHVATGQDPNWVASLKKSKFHFPKTRRQFAIEVLKHGLGRYTLADLKGYTVNAGMSTHLPRATRLRAAAWGITLAGMATYFGLWEVLLLYWIVPLATFLMAILYLRDVGEHFGMPAPGIERSRTVLAGWLERLLIAQNGVNFHAEHHLFPSVPFFRLRRLHQALMQSAAYRANAVITRGYLSGLFAEAAAEPPLQVRLLCPADVPALVALEQSKWEPHQAASAEQMLERIQAHPDLCIGAFCPRSGQALASLFMRPVDPAMFTAPTGWAVAADVRAGGSGAGAGARTGPERSLFGISLSSNHAAAVQAIFAFFYPRALRAGWRDVYLGSPIPGFARARAADPRLRVWQYVHARRRPHDRLPLDAQLRYYFSKGFTQIVSIQERYFPHAESLDHGVILRGVIPLSGARWLWRTAPFAILESLSPWAMRWARLNHGA